MSVISIETPLLKVSQVAKVLGLAPPTVYDLIARGTLKGCRLTPGAVRVAPADLNSYLAECYTGTAADAPAVSP